MLPGTGGKSNTFFDLTGPGIAKFGAFNRAHYANALYVAPDQALIMTVKQPDDSEYWNLQTGDIWYQVEDYIFHQTSLNQLQAQRDSDGLYRLVIAHQDPGVAVWRVYGPKGHIEMPKLECLALSDLARHLPADTPSIAAEQRRA